VAADSLDRDPPPARAATVIASRVDPEHPKRPLPPVALTAKPVGDAIQTLLGFESPGAPVVSMYWSVPEDPGRLKGAKSSLRDLVRAVRDRADSHDLPHADRASLRADAGRILELEELVPALQGRTVALFRCSQRDFEEAVVLPGWVRDRIALDATPYLRPLLAVLDEAHRYAVVIVDREHGRLFEFYLGVLEARAREDGRALRKPDFAQGDKEHGVRNRAEELAKRHYRDVAAALDHFVNEKGIELVVVGGHEDTVPAFLELLPHHLRQKVVGTFVADPHTLTPAAARDEAQRAIDDYERREEEQLVALALEKVATGGLGAAGLDWCLLAANEQAVQHLLVQADASATGRVCDRCGWLGLEGDECPVDGRPTRDTPDVIDDMAARVVDTSGSVEHVYADTPLRDHSVAAILRFPVPATAAARS
jgi:peptide chain release factor subunit 1